jgi:MarR family transcriptional regulator, organic hydroperoxide resistance regulator
VLVSITPAGGRLMRTLYPAFNAEESKVVGELDGEQREALAESLRAIMRTVEQLG